MSRTNVYNHGVIHVQGRMCDTCIFRPGNLMSLDEGRVEGMVREATAEDGCIPCHDTTHMGGQEAVCRGFFNKHRTPTLELGKVLGVIKYVEVT